MSRIYNSVSSSTNKTATGSSAPTMSDKKALFSSSSTSNNTNTNSTTNISANIHHLQQHNNKPSPQPPSTSSVNKFTHHNIDQSHTTTSVNLTGIHIYKKDYMHWEEKLLLNFDISCDAK